MPALDRPADPASRTDFWEGVHGSKPVDGVSWWQSVPELSLALVDQAQVGRDDPIIPHTESVALADRLYPDRVSLYLVDGLSR